MNKISKIIIDIRLSGKIVLEKAILQSKSPLLMNSSMQDLKEPNTESLDEKIREESAYKFRNF